MINVDDLFAHSKERPPTEWFDFMVPKLMKDNGYSDEAAQATAAKIWWRGDASTKAKIKKYKNKKHREKKEKEYKKALELVGKALVKIARDL